MKKLLLLVALCFCASVASAQTIEIVHLKNGGQIRGVITEQIPNKQLKIQTSDGSVFVYSYDEIEKITKELHGQGPASAYGNQRRASAYGNRQNSASASPFQPYYECGVDAGYSIGVGDGKEYGRLNVSTTHGFRVIPNLYVGAGVGFDYYFYPEVFGMPIFADFRGDFTYKAVKPFLNFRIGYSVCDVDGFYFSPSVGVNYKMMDVSFGYTYQSVEGGVNLGGITFKVGLRF